MGRSNRLALTLIELLVVISVIGLLMAIAMPAVQMAREAARQKQCSSQLKMIGIGLQNYESTHGMFPSALYCNTVHGRVLGSSKHYSAQCHLLPFLEEADLFNSINFLCPFHEEPNGVMKHRENSTAASTVVATFLCPSDGQRLRINANNNYRLNLGHLPYRFDYNRYPQITGPGAFTPFAWYAARDFVDGLSQTVGMSEKIIGAGRSNHFVRSRDFWYSGALQTGSLPEPASMRRICESLTLSNPPHYADAGLTWMVAGFENTFYNHVVPPNWTSSDCAVEQEGQHNSSAGGAFAARSLHPNGVYCLFMGGEVRLISDGVSLDIWRAMATRSGGDMYDRSAK